MSGPEGRETLERVLREIAIIADTDHIAPKVTWATLQLWTRELESLRTARETATHDSTGADPNVCCPSCGTALAARWLTQADLRAANWSPAAASAAPMGEHAVPTSVEAPAAFVVGKEIPSEGERIDHEDAHGSRVTPTGVSTPDAERADPDRMASAAPTMETWWLVETGQPEGFSDRWAVLVVAHVWMDGGGVIPCHTEYRDVG